MQWLNQKKKQSFFLQRQAVFCEFRTTSDAWPPWATSCWVMQLLFTPCDILDVTRPRTKTKQWRRVGSCQLHFDTISWQCLLACRWFNLCFNKQQIFGRFPRKQTWPAVECCSSSAVDRTFDSADQFHDLVQFLADLCSLFCQKATKETEQKTARLLHPSQVAYICGPSSVRGYATKHLRDTDSDYVMEKPSRCWVGAVPRYWKQGSPQEFLPAGEKAGEAWQWAGGPGALPRKILDFCLLKTRFLGIFEQFLMKKSMFFLLFFWNVFMHFLVGRSNFDNFFQPKKAVGPQRKTWLDEGDCICVNEDFFSWPFISALSPLFSSPFFFLSFLFRSTVSLCLSTKSSNPRHGLDLSSCAWPRRSFPLPVTFKRKDIIAVRKTSRILALLSIQRLAPTGMSGSMPFEHCKSPLIVFESAKVSEVFDVRGKQERRREAGPVRLSKKCYLQKTNASPWRTWQNPTTQCLQNPSFAIDKPTAALALRKIPRSSMPSWLLFSPVLSHSATSCETAIARACNALQRATLSRPEVPRGICVTCTWFDTHRHGFRDRLSAVRLAPRGSRGALWGNSRISPSHVWAKRKRETRVFTLFEPF